MTKFYAGKKFRFASLFLTLSLLLASCGLAATPVAQEPLKSSARDRSIAVNFTRLLELRHVSKQKLDVGLSERGFELFLKAVDPTKLYLTRQDVDEFEAKYAKLCELDAKKLNDAPAVYRRLDVAFEVYNRFLQRVDERVALAQKMLDENNFDFTVDEEFVREPELLDYPKSDAEIADRLRRRAKFELLSLEAEKRDEEKEKAENANETPKTASAVPGRPDDPISKLKRRYSTLQKRLRQTSNDDLLEIYLTAVANAYDPHTTFMSPKSYENFMIQIGLNLEGIGATLQWDDGYTIVKRIVKGSPAEKQGELKVEDKIVGVGQGVDGEIEDVVDMKLTDVVEKIRGKGGTTVRLEVVSEDGKRKIVPIVREKIDLEDSAAQSAVFVAYQKADGTVELVDEADAEAKKPADAVAELKVGVIDLPSFYLDMKAKNSGGEGRSSSTDVEKYLEEFNAKNVDACVLDLRYNGGGSLPEAVSLTGLFIETGSVVQVKPSELGLERARSLNDPDAKIVWQKPLVVLTSRLSASASEIFAGAIRDYGRGLVVGDETTHGKGSVQSMNEISSVLFNSLLREAPNMGAMKVTIQGFYLPSGVSPQLQGVPSHVVLPQFTSVLEDIAESDLDYPLSFEKIAPARYPKFNLTSPSVVDSVAKKSAARVAASEDFAKEVEKMELYRTSKLRKATPLQREKYFAELDKLDASKEETEKMEEIVNGESGVKRDYYLDEVLRLTKDYYEALQTQALAL
ncbi:MAG: carboxy terminal-processing peptidase [Thermoguttaceae bacterium]|nr:carboxy terminal-processing peptidase [Thermoguttaceae bacterium]